MKKVMQMCSECKEETWHMIGKKQAHDGDKHYIRRTTCECTQCGRKEINNRSKGKRIIFKRKRTLNHGKVKA